jgi:putative phage-type endonuclease
MTTTDKAVQVNEDDFLEVIEIPSPTISPGPEFPSTEKDCEDLQIAIYDLIDQYIKDFILAMAKPIFMTELTDDIAHIIFQQLVDAKICTDSEYDSLYSFVSEQCEQWFAERIKCDCPVRHSPHIMDNILVCEFSQDEEFAREYNSNKLIEIYKKDQANPQQRTPEWYQHRYNMLTASNLWQALGSDAQRNRLIFEKCKPLETQYIESKWVSTEGSLHWGVKFEPLTVMIYEKQTGTKIGNFGCITHSQYSFLGASPDGIVINPESPLFGRLVEIKNIFNREMDGIPSEAYWIQMQIQMQCCELEACDFVETRFKEYEFAQAFHEEEDTERIKGIILQFVARDSLSNIPLYKYSPLDLSQTELTDWIEKTKEEVAELHILFKTHYWYLDNICMTTIQRNDAWFSAALPKIQETWDIILKERVSGYEHRAAKKRNNANTLVVESKQKGSVCLIKLTDEEINE